MANRSSSLFKALLSIVHRLVEIVWALALLGLAVSLYLWIAGISSDLINRVFQAVDTGPCLVTADHLRLKPSGELAIENVLVYRRGSFEEPILRIGKVAVQLDMRALLRARVAFDRFQIHDARLFFAPFSSASDQIPRRLVVTNIHALVRRERDVWKVEVARASLQRVQAEATGAVRVEPGDGGINVAKFFQALEKLADAPQRADRTTQVIFEKLERDLEQPLALRLILGGTAQSLAIQFLAEGDLQFLAWLPLKRMEGNIEWAPDRFSIASLRAEGQHGLQIDARTEERADGSHMLAARLSFDRLSLQGVHFAQGFGRLEAYPNGIVALKDVAMRLGPDGERGRAAFHLTWDRSRHVAEGSFDLNFDPNDMAPFLTSNQVKFARRFSFSNHWPRFVGDFRRTSNPTNLFVRGELTAEHFSYRGVPIDAMRADLMHSNDWIHLENWRFSKGSGITTGRLVAATHEHIVDVDLFSTMHPADIAGLIGTRLHQAISQWQFEGPVQINAFGRADSSGSERLTDLTVDVRGERLGRARWLADSAEFTVRAERGMYRVTNLAGRAYGGALEGTVVVEPTDAGPEHRFRAAVSLKGADLSRIARARAWSGETAWAGRLDLSVSLTGLVSDAFGPVTRGGGVLVIEDGEILRTPLFGGLSELLSKLVPGLGFVSQTDLECSFRIEEGAIRTDDLHLAGDVISLRARGEVEFDERIRMDVQVVLMRRGPIAALLRFLTFPVTKLFEFRLSGTLKEPRWRPLNLPKEMFLIFD